MFVRQSISDLTFNIAQVNERKGLLSFEKIKLCHTLNPFKVFQCLEIPRLAKIIRLSGKLFV